MKEQQKSRCLLCSLGCGFVIETQFDEAVNLEYDLDNPVNRGALCSRGNYILELINHSGRLIEPQVGGKPRGWNDTLDMIAGKMARYVGTRSAGLILEGDASTEDIITAQFFAEKCLGNDRIAVNFSTGDDSVYRTLASMSIPTSSIQPEEIESSEYILAVGDPFEIGPVVAGRVLRAKYARRTNALTVISGTPNRTSRFATTHLAGSERKTLAQMLRVLADQPECAGCSWLNVVKESQPSPADTEITSAVRAFLEKPSSVMILETQDPVTAGLAGAFVAASGKDKGLLYISTYGNVGGICEVCEGRDTVESMIDSAEHGELKVLIVLGADMISSVPGRDVKSALGKLEFLVAGAPFENETTGTADPVLPTALWVESEGTYNGSLLNPVVGPPGGALSYGEILRRLTSKMGVTLPAVSSEPVLEHRELTGEDVKVLMQKSDEEAFIPAVRTTTIKYADGSLTDNMSWIKLQGRKAW